MVTSPLTLTIIVPVYNTERYLRRCIDSILNQSFVDYELLLIDDGSIDGSGLVCDEYAKKDDRIHVFHKDNGGVSSARNLGLDKASGEWVYFVDSDDIVLPGGLQTMVGCISDDIDMVLAGYERYNEKGSVINIVNERAVIKLDKKRSLSILYETHELMNCYLGYVWNRLFRSKIIQYYNLRYDSELRIKEDTLFVTQYILRSNGTTFFTTTPVYRYYERGNSAMGVLNKGFDYRLIDGFHALIKMKQDIATFFSPYSEIVYTANEGIWIRYHRILHRMETFDARDEELCCLMKETMKRELGLTFFVRKKLRNLKRKWFQMN